MKVNKKIQDIELIKNDENYLVLYNENYFSVGQLFYEVIEELKSNNHEKENFIKTHDLSQANYDELSCLISEKIEDIVSKSETSKKYIKLPVTILSEKNVIRIAGHLEFLFQKKVIKILLPIVIAVAILSQIIINNKYNDHTIFEMSIFDTVLVYCSILIIMIFHELGHSSASKHFKVEPKEIGFGFYILFPVLFSNVTRIWKLNKNEKVVVNLGGIYFQGLINCFFLPYLLFNTHYEQVTYLLLLIIKANLFVMAYSLFPFVRNDGYWVVSDYFNIINLNKKSYSYIFDLIKNKEPLNYSLLLYSIGQYLFIIFLCQKYLPTIPNNIAEFINYINASGVVNLIVKNPGLVLKLIFSLLIGFVSLTTLIKFLIPFFKSKKISDD